MGSTPKLHAFTSAMVELTDRAVWRCNFHATAPPFRSATTPETEEILHRAKQSIHHKNLSYFGGMILRAVGTREFACQ